MPFVYLVVLALSATCVGSSLAFVCIALGSLYRNYTSAGLELFGTYAVALIVPMTLIGVVFGASVGMGIWSVRKLFKRDIKMGLV